MCSYVISLSFLLALILMDNSYAQNNLGLFIFAIPLILVFYNSELNNLRVFSTLNSLDKSIMERMRAENDEKLGRERVADARALMGNVAHDLKTPMQTILSGIEHLNFMLASLEHSNTSNSLRASTSFENAFETLDLMETTCTFMSMSINQSLDCT